MFIRLNTILIPDPAVVPDILNLAQEITAENSPKFRIDNEKFFAHITLYSPEFPVKNVEKVFEAVANLAKYLNTIELEFEDLYTSLGYIGLDFKRNDELHRLHETAVSTLNPLREGRIRDDYIHPMQRGVFSPIEKENIENYGFHLVLSNYQPHLTLARFDSEAIALAVKKSAQHLSIPKKIAFSSLGVSEMGPNGTCTKILKRDELKPFRGPKPQVGETVHT